MSEFFAWLFLLLLAAGGVYHLIQKLKYDKLVKKGQETIAQLSHDLHASSQNLERLSKYEGIHDLDQETVRLEGAIKLQESHLKDAEAEVSEAKKKASETILAAKDKANLESARILKSAEQRAEETAGDAYKALRDSEKLNQMVKAIKNSIDGYGDEYLVPNHAALDDLAEEYSHKEAGEDLEIARDNVKRMVKLGLAAECDYAQTDRKQTAIRFVLDAFNGKVESTLSKVKRDNFGKLRQEIQDAYQMVNNHGEAFRNARIRIEYLDARLTELKWAVAVTELKEQEREEQRQIKQEMREEEKARREYEKAIKEAQKEEKLLEKLMAEARSKLQEASEEERAEYESKIQDLEQKWKEAEEKNQRALSMAQQTRSGHVYVISNIGSFGDDVFKIGLTRRLEPIDRVKELGDASVPFGFDVHAMIYNEDAPKLENTLHHVFTDFQMNKVNPRKEFFKVGITQIKEALDKIGIEAKWTMKSEALEHRESKVLEQQQSEKVIRDPDEAVAEMLAASATERPVDQVVPESEPESELPAAAQKAEDLVECPRCQTGIPVSSLSAGDNTCPGCDANIEVSIEG
jgi:hypothetical protein|tara:strand:+ start:10510 stop:12237 length:1728 start_codon:yes stop_codon:yes gene_type:complete